MAKFSVGQAVEIAFNPQQPDPRVPNQLNGTYPGKGEYQTVAQRGVIHEVIQRDGAVLYLVGDIGASKRQRHVAEGKLSAI